MTRTNVDLWLTGKQFIGLPYKFGRKWWNIPVEEILRRRLPADCSGFTAEVGRLNGSDMPDGASAQEQHCRALGLTISRSEAREELMCLAFRIQANGENHVACPITKGATIEEANRRVGCATLNFDGRPWTSFARFPNIEYVGAAAKPPAPDDAAKKFEQAILDCIHLAKGHVLQPFGNNDPSAVQILQHLLNERFKDLPGHVVLAENGQYDVATVKVVKYAQLLAGQAASGTTDRALWDWVFPF